jgi:hypothetical protein
MDSATHQRHGRSARRRRGEIQLTSFVEQPKLRTTVRGAATATPDNDLI